MIVYKVVVLDTTNNKTMADVEFNNFKEANAEYKIRLTVHEKIAKAFKNNVFIKLMKNTEVIKGNNFLYQEDK